MQASQRVTRLAGAPRQLSDAVSLAPIIALLTRQGLIVELVYFGVLSFATGGADTLDLGFSFSFSFNYMYLRSKPIDNSLLNVMGP